MRMPMVNHLLSAWPAKRRLLLLVLLCCTLLSIDGPRMPTAWAQAGVWKPTGSMSTPRTDFTATLLPNGQVLVAGGTENWGTPPAFASAEVYHLQTRQWTATGSMQEPRQGHRAILLPSGKVLVMGGGDLLTIARQSAEIYDPDTGTWTYTGSMQTPRVAPSATLITTGPLAGQVFVAGGSSSASLDQPLASAELYDPSTGIWTLTGNLTLARWWEFQGIDRGMTFSDGSVLVVGGITCCPFQRQNYAELFDPLTQTWRATSSKTTDAQFATILLPHDQAFVAGGDTAARAEIYAHPMNLWTPTASMEEHREALTLTRLPNGRILAAGAVSESRGSSELYDPITGQWAPAEAMVSPRIHHQAVLLRNGKVLVMGGANKVFGTVLASAELYIPPPPEAPPLLLSLGDIDQDDSPEIAVVTYDARRKRSNAWVRTARNGAFIGQIDFDGDFVPQKAETVNDLNGNSAAEIAVLGVRYRDQAVQVEVRDSRSGVQLSTLRFPALWSLLDLAIIRNLATGTATVAVLQQQDTSLRVQRKDTATGTSLRMLSFTPGYTGVALRILADLNGNQTPELAVLANHPTAASQVEIRDSQTQELLHIIPYDAGAPLQQLVHLLIRTPGGERVDNLAVLREGVSDVIVTDLATGVTVNTLTFALSDPYKLVRVTDNSSDSKLALLGKRPNDGQIRAHVYNVRTNNRIATAIYEQYGTTVGFLAIPDVNGNGVGELVRLREQPGPQKWFAEVHDGDTGERIQGMYFGPP